MRILLAENDVMLADALIKSLRPLGHEVSWCWTGGQAEEFLRQSEWDATILDVVMPGKNGIQVIRDCKGRLPARVIVTTALDVGELSGLPPGTMVLLKPYTTDELLLALEGHSRVQPNAD